MALITCQARVTSMSPGCSCTGSHHQATGMRVIMTQPSPSCFGPFCTRMSISLRLVALGLEPEVDGVLLLRLVLVVEDGIGEPAIAFHAAHDLDLLEDEIEVGVELGIVEHEGAVLGALGDHLLDRGC